MPPIIRATLGFCLLLGAGCANTHSQGKGDPLVGEIHPAPHGPYHPVPPNPPSHTKNPNVPPIPSTQGPVTNAALASMDGSRNLSIGTNFPNAPGGQPASFIAPAGSGSPKVMPLPRDTSPPSVPTMGSYNANQHTFEILQDQLRKRGVLYQKQESVPEGIKFTCMIPHPTSQDSVKVYEATARDYPTAVQAVLLQIDQKK